MNIRGFLSRAALQELTKLPRSVSKRIMARIGEMEERLDQLDIKRVVGQRAYRLRVGDYRVIFDLDMTTGSTNILKVPRRSTIYK